VAYSSGINIIVAIRPISITRCGRDRQTPSVIIVGLVVLSN